jgi:hypothetical protein
MDIFILSRPLVPMLKWLQCSEYELEGSGMEGKEVGPSTLLESTS